MRTVNKTAQSDQIGRLLGYDIYRYDFSIQEMDDYESVKQGYREAEIQSVSKIKRSSMFQRKLMQIRCRAFRKGIEVTISESDLKSAYDECKGVCPVTLHQMTSAETTDTDWSVDRLDNHLGYIPNNIVVMSSVANIAKGDLSLHDLVIYCIIKETNEHNQDRLSQKSNKFWMNMLRAYAQKMPDYLFANVMKEICEDDDYCTGLIKSLYLQLIPSLYQDSLNKTKKIWKNSPLLSRYMHDGTISQADLIKMRKTASSTVKKVKINSYNLSQLDILRFTDQLFINDPRTKDIMSKLVLSWINEIENDEQRRTVIMRALIHGKHEWAAVHREITVG